MKIGILAVQGDFEAHGRMLERLGVEYRLVKRPEELEGLDGLILPGGESTTMLKFLEEEGLGKAIKTFAALGKAVFGTCTGAILLAGKVTHPEQPALGLMDMTVARNAYGRQIASAVKEGRCDLKQEPLEMVFIRAPIIAKVGEGLEVLAKFEGQPVFVQQGRLMVTTFHPELTGDTTIHEYFLKIVRDGKA
ncbi:MAG TPA: pyridoxal 5'-phosphate synthase glutaminase subunit PdxT [Candidatus Acidoferrales bacterium]